MDRLFLFHHRLDRRFVEQLDVALRHLTTTSLMRIEWPQRDFPFESSDDAAVAIVVSPGSVDDDDSSYKYIIGSNVFLRQNTVYLSTEGVELDQLPIPKGAHRVELNDPAAVASQLISLLKSSTPRAVGAAQRAALLYDAPQVVPDRHGKEEVLRFLHRELSTDRRNAVALCGFNGTGKTVAVRLFMADAQDNFSAASWISLRHPRGIDEVVAQLGRLPELQLDVTDELALPPARRLFALLLRHRMLLVFDDLESILPSIDPDRLRADPSGERLP